MTAMCDCYITFENVTPPKIPDAVAVIPRLLSSTPGGPAGPADPEANRPQDGLRSHLRVRFRTLPWASSGHVTTRSMSPQHLRSPMPTFATKKLSTGANGQKEDASLKFLL